MRRIVCSIVILLGCGLSPTRGQEGPQPPAPAVGVLKQVLASDRVEVEGVGQVRLLGVEFINDEPGCLESDVAAVLNRFIGQRVAVDVDRTFWQRNLTPPDHGAYVRLDDGRYLNDFPLLTGCARLRSESAPLYRWGALNCAWQQAQTRNLKRYRVR